MNAQSSVAGPPNLSIRTQAPSPKRLSRKVLLAGALSGGGLIAWALIGGLSDQRRANETGDTQAVAAVSGPPETIQQASASYDPKGLAAPRDMLWGDHVPPEPVKAAELQPPAERTWSDAPPQPQTAPRGVVAPDLQKVAQAAPILFDERSGAQRQAPAGEGLSQAGVGGARSAFLTSQRGAQDDFLPTKLAPPRSPYEVQAGAVISAALLTELNSDLPGRVIAQVTAPVYDSVTGEHLLIPQGARLIGTYDSATTHGDKRIMLAWNRIIFPTGWSINLQGMEAGDPSGAAGLRDKTDNHLGPLAGAIGLATVFSVIANNAEGDRRDRSLGQTVGDAAAQEAARTGGKIVDRSLQVRPTLRVRVGAPVRVLVSRDIQLRPYRGS